MSVSGAQRGGAGGEAGRDQAAEMEVRNGEGKDRGDGFERKAAGKDTGVWREGKRTDERVMVGHVRRNGKVFKHHGDREPPRPTFSW